MSYHILFYEDGDFDAALLEEGIKNVLSDASKRRLRSLSFFALGFDLVARAEQKQKNILAGKIADKTAEIVVGYLLSNKNKYIPKLVFNFVSVLTMLTYEKAFSKWADFKKPYFAVMKQVSERQKNIVVGALTRDQGYIEKLKELTFSMDDKSSILLLGESGVGKSYLSKVLHKNSSKSGSPFKEVNCQQISRELIYTHMFGAVKGSYTGATRDIAGAVETAEGGILFLDEIAYADIEVQRSLLKFLDEGKYSRLGEESVTKHADVKLIFGTNVDLEKGIEENAFAHDLYERIAQNIVTIPPLRNRRDDVGLLVEYFKNDLNSNSAFKIEIQKETVELLQTYNWPGNVRQLGHYLGDIFRKARNKNILVITADMITTNPPRNDLKAKNPIRNLEAVLLELLPTWKPEKGDLLSEIIKPILAKIYIEDFHGVIKQSSKYIGIQGTRGTKKALTPFYEKYPKLKDLLE